MIFPFSKKSRPAIGEDTIGRIDRHLADRTFRLMIGINLEPGFDRVSGCLLVTSGRGKYLRIRYVDSCVEMTPEPIRQGLRGLDSQQVSVHELCPLLHDLADVQTEVAERLKLRAGKVVDRILAISVTDPGYWMQDFDDRQNYLPLTDAHRIAELTGITVVDAFPARDLAVGGVGRHLECLPMWLTFADRNPQVATEHRLLIQLDDQAVSMMLPPSDGLDSELPEIRVSQTTGLQLLRRLLSTRSLPAGNSWQQWVNDLYVTGQVIEPLFEQWVEMGSGNSKEQLEDLWIQAANSRFPDGHGGGEHLVCTALAIVARQIRAEAGSVMPQRLVLCADPDLRGTLINLFARVFPEASVESVENWPQLGSSSMGALSAGLLGMLHIDQVPASIPWVTGANSQRILGRITPGSPSNWRQLVRDMADYCPPAMKLRDAV